MILVKLINKEYTGTEEFFNRAVDFIHLNDSEFDIDGVNLKIHGLKLMRDSTGGTLKDCKDVCQLYWAGKILNKKEIRKEKLKKITNVY